MGDDDRLTASRQVALVVLRTLIGWHFLYEGYYKLILPGWSSAGERLAGWSAAGYIRAGSGPLAWLLQRMLDAGWGNWLDRSLKIGLVVIGLSLMLGLLTRLGSVGALLLLLLFYFTLVPLTGTQQAGTEGAYLIVNKTLVEAAAVLVLLVFDTGRLAGLDLFIAGWRNRRSAGKEQK